MVRIDKNNCLLKGYSQHSRPVTTNECGEGPQKSFLEKSSDDPANGQSNPEMGADVREYQYSAWEIYALVIRLWTWDFYKMYWIYADVHFVFILWKYLLYKMPTKYSTALHHTIILRIQTRQICVSDFTTLVWDKIIVHSAVLPYLLPLPLFLKFRGRGG